MLDDNREAFREAQPALAVAPDGAERQEDGQHCAEEHRAEHREPQQRGADEHLGVDAEPVRADLPDVAVELPGPERVEAEESDGQQRDDEKDPAPQRLAQREGGDDLDLVHASPTASRYASSSVEVSTRTP